MNDKLRLGVYLAGDIPQSFRVYASNILKYFPMLGIEPVFFQGAHDLPKAVDVLWDIRSGGGNPPLEFMLGYAPLVITTHGFAPITLPGWEYFKTLRGAILSRHYAKHKIVKWQQLKDGVSALIAVSEFTKTEAIRLTGVGAEKIYVCHHGVDTENFTPGPENQHNKPYLLHISNNEPRKNVDRIIGAFQKLTKTHDIELILKLPSQHAVKFQGLAGVKLIENMLSDKEIADLYRGAMAFVFPSLYEGFGLPILEAMACGCPVITSNTSACPEVAGNSALIIDPRDKTALHQAMIKACERGKSRPLLIQSGYQRVSQFNWESSARKHGKVFQQIANSR
ncbi:MAG: glycosyltransferase family 4 protein [Methylobacter sp.]